MKSRTMMGMRRIEACDIDQLFVVQYLENSALLVSTEQTKKFQLIQTATDVDIGHAQ